LPNGHAPQLDNFVFKADQEVKIEVLEEGTNFITLHSKFLHITAAAVEFKVDGKDKKLEMISMKFDVKHHVATFEFEETMPTGDVVFSCSFEGELNNQMAGFYRSTYTDLDGKKKVGVYFF
jgi:puromycin-sensitive aminopeptidase